MQVSALTGHLLLIAAIVAIVGVGSSLGDEIISGGETKSNTGQQQQTTKPVNLSDKAKVLQTFFEHQGISVDPAKLEDPKFVDRYKDEVAIMMSSYPDVANQFTKAYRLNSNINSMIYHEVSETIKKVDYPFEMADEIVLQTLDLIVPDSDSEPLYRSAKEDLRQFFTEKPELGRDLLHRVDAALESGEFHTEDAITYLRSFYYGWIPLGRLADFIETNGISGH